MAQDEESGRTWHDEAEGVIQLAHHGPSSLPTGPFLSVPFILLPVSLAQPFEVDHQHRVPRRDLQHARHLAKQKRLNM